MELFCNIRQRLGIWYQYTKADSYREQKWNMYLNEGNDILVGNFFNVKIIKLGVNIKGCDQYQKTETNET